MGVTSNKTYNFDLDFASYGDSEDTIEYEIRQDVIRTLTTSLQSSFFARSAGAGIESIENERLSEVDFVLYRFQITNGLLTYNDTVAPERQIVLSQSMVEITEGDSPAELVIRLAYILAKNVNQPNVTPTVISTLVNLG